MHRFIFVFFSFLFFFTANAQAQDEEAETQPDASQSEKIEEVYIFSNKRANFTEITENTQKLIDMPGALGDPLAAVFSLPGVVYSDGEGGSPAVRGSSPDDNLFLVDFMPAGYIFHEFNTSVFSENIVQDFQLYSAGFGATYGDVTGAVFDIKLREPRNQPLETTIDLSMLRSGIFIEGGVGENSAFYISARKSLIHLFIPEDDIEEEEGIRIKEAPQDDDYQIKYAIGAGDGHTFTLSASGASDSAEVDFSEQSDVVQRNPDFLGEARLEQRYDGQNLVWDYIDNSGVWAKVGVGHLAQHSDIYWGDTYFYDVLWEQNTLRTAVGLPWARTHELTIGGDISDSEYTLDYDTILFVCTEFEPDCNLNRRERVAGSLGLERRTTNAFIEDSWRLFDRVTLNYGVQYNNNDYTDESFLNPRASVLWDVSQNISLSFKAGKYNRFPDVNTVWPEIGNPALDSQQSTHYAIGIEQSLKAGWSWSIESYYKALTDLPAVINENESDASQLYSNDTEGRAYGMDILVNKDNQGKWYGWFALSMARSERTDLRSGITRDYYLDTPVIANLVGNYRVLSWFDIGLRWSLRSGRSYTPITGIEENPDFPGFYIPVYAEPFSDRLPTYSRMDLRFQWDVNIFNHDAAVILDIINALNQQPVIERDVDYEKVQQDGELHIEEVVGIGIVPALSFRVTF